jgi:HEPN superfamily protein
MSDAFAKVGERFNRCVRMLLRWLKWRGQGQDMLMSEFPSADEWQAIYAASPYPSILLLAVGLSDRLSPQANADRDAFAQRVSLSRLEVELYNRVLDVARSYVFMAYFHSQGIPDHRWFISPGRAGQSVEYFPDFQEGHFVTKSWFDYYADTFYQKLFAAWAVVGHVVNEMFALGLTERQVDFAPAIKRLADGDLATALTSVLQNDAYEVARRLRNDISHNEAPSSVGMTVSKYETDKAFVRTMGMKRYVTSGAIFENAGEMATLLRQTLEALETCATPSVGSVVNAFQQD